MQLIDSESAPAASRWSSRIALFALGLLITAYFCHRLLGMTTPVAANLFAVAQAAAAFSIVAAVFAAIRIWRRGVPGTARIVFGVSLSSAILLIPLVVLALAAPYPAINDITTDWTTPPEFLLLAKDRPPGSNSSAYPGADFAASQGRAYPDIRPIVLQRPAEEAFELVIEALKRMKMQVVRQEAPGATREDPGAIEASDRTLVFGFYDDVAVRVAGDDTRSRIDMRSASRFGLSDFGRNAERLRQLTLEIELRVAATQPVPGEERPPPQTKAGAKSRKGADQKPGSPRRPQGRDR